jgi:hypothetical protein
VCIAAAAVPARQAVVVNEQLFIHTQLPCLLRLEVCFGSRQDLDKEVAIANPLALGNTSDTGL